MTAFRHRFPVNWVDTDALSVVHFSNYFRYFEKTEEAFYASTGIDHRGISEKHSIAFPRVDVKCTYEFPCRFGDEVEVSLKLSELKDKAVSLNFEVMNVTGGKVAAKGSVTLVCVDTTRWKAVSIPSELREVYERLS